MASYDYIYDFTNENVASFGKLYDFKDKDVLTVLGSGDQYFTAVLNGAKNVSVMDINEFAWYYFVLKFTAIRVLSYDEFYSFFINCGLNNRSIYMKLREYLPSGVRDRFDLILNNGLLLSSIKLQNKIFIPPKKDDGSIIPYFKIEKYYQLQEMLNTRSLPEFIIGDFWRLKITQGYDLMLLSNIADYINAEINEFRERLNTIDCSEIQALYVWDKEDDVINNYVNAGFTLDYVPTCASFKSKDDKDIVLSLRK